MSMYEQAGLYAIPDQPKTSIYGDTSSGHVVIYQEDHYGEYQASVRFTPGVIPELIRWLQREYNDFVEEYPPVQPADPPQSLAPPTPEPMPQRPQKKKDTGA